MKKNIKITFMRSLVMLPMAALCLHGQAASAGTSNTSGKYEGQSLCDAGDEIVDACVTQSGKTVSICGTTKQKPSIMYLIYGTPEKIEVSSPRKGEFPLKHSNITVAGYSFYFSQNGKYYIQYHISEARGSFDQSGFIIRNIADHKIIIHDLCKSDLEYSERLINSFDYIDRQINSKSHNYDIDGNYDDTLSDLITETDKDK